jgi:hypothetical protein
VGVSEELILRDCRITDYMIQENGLDAIGFKEWIFYPGMLFEATIKWWGDQGVRDNPHEGLDLCLYRDRSGMIRHLDEKTKVPAIYKGKVVRIVDDFLGKSIIIEHVLSGKENDRVYSFYGHAIPAGNLHVGKTVTEGDVIARLADTRGSRTKILPHLHISLGISSRTVSHDTLNWENMVDPDSMTLLDPLQAMTRPYHILAPSESIFSMPGIFFPT